MMISKIQELIQNSAWQEAKEQLALWRQELDFVFTDAVAILEASIWMAEQNWAASLDVIYRGIGINPENHELYFMLGQVKEAVGNVWQAQLCYENAIYFSTKEDNEMLCSYYQTFLAQTETHLGKVSIVLVTYNQLDYTKLCVDTIRQTTPAGTYEIIVVDNLSTDGTREWLQTQPGFKVILNDVNKGFPTACNQGAALAEKGNDIFILNNDTIVLTNSIFNLRMALYETKRTGAVGAVSNEAGGAQVITETFKTLDDYIKYARKNNCYSPQKHDKCLRLTGFAMLLKYTIWNEVKGFDEIYGMGHFEDDDLCLQLLLKEYDLRVCKDAFIFHFGHMSFNAVKEKSQDAHNELLYRNRDIFNDKWKVQWAYFTHCRHELIEKITHSREDAFSLLEVGCAAGANLLEIENRYPYAETYGIELSESVADIAKHYLNVVQGNIEEKINYFGKKYDYILLADVLEHTHEPWDLLNTMKEWLKPGGRFIICLPNVMHISVLLPLLHGRFTYEDEGILNRTHLRFFTKKEIVDVMSQSGLHLERMGAFMVSLSERETLYIKKLIQMDGIIAQEELQAYQYWIVASNPENV